MKHNSPGITLQHQLWLLSGMTLAALPHMGRIPVWVSLMYVILTGWMMGGSLFGWPLPDRSRRVLVLAKYALAVAGLFAVIQSYGSLSGRDPGVALLVLLSGFKFLETRSERDFYIAVCLSFILVVTNFFYTQTIPTALFMAVVVLVLTTCFVVLNDRNQGLGVLQRLRLAGILLLQACPLMLVMFLLFPRVPGPLWGLPKDAHSGIVGIDDAMSPGSISQLLNSDALAFRVKFHGDTPEKGRFYWRGPVLTHNDGQRWSRNENLFFPPQNNLENLGNSISYTVTLEPTNQRWLFALEMPPRASDGQLTNDYQILQRKRVQDRIRYDQVSWPDYQLTGESDRVRQAALQLPEGYHPRTIEHARQWRREGMSDQQIIERAMRWFNEEEFYYTRQPPLLEGDNIDEFLFETRRGFCEHYASSFVVLMRAADIPARVVTGYLGATYNPIGDYYNVYQRDAHAWAEVWLDGSGWQRVDPTSAVSPLRVLEGIEHAIPEVRGSFGLAYGNNSLAVEVMRQFIDSWDNLNYQWSQWVLGYGPKRQKELMSFLGFHDVDWQSLTISLVIIIAALLAAIGGWFFLRQPGNREPSRRLYDRFCAKLAQLGMSRRPYEGPHDFAARAARRYPRLKETIMRITGVYVAVRYGSETERLAELRDQVRRFKPGQVVRAG